MDSLTNSINEILDVKKVYTQKNGISNSSCGTYDIHNVFGSSHALSCAGAEST